MSTRRRLAMVVALVGVAFVGKHLADAWPRTVEVVYEVGADTAELDVDYLLGGDAVASARFHQSSEKTPVFRHSVRLRPGEYRVHITVYGERRSAFEAERALIVPARGVTRFEVGPATVRSE